MTPAKPPEDDCCKPPPVPGNAALRAVLTGIGIHVCGSTLLNIVLTSLYVAQAGTPGMTATDIDDLARNMPPESPLSLLGILLGSLISVAAGYVCARIARRNEFRLGALMAGCTALIGLLLADTDRVTTGFLLLLLACGAACNLLGVKYGVAQNRRLDQPAEPPADTTAS